MATLRYKNPTTHKWELVGVSGGGGSNNKLLVGAFCSYIGDVLSDAYWDIAAALSCKPLATT